MVDPGLGFSVPVTHWEEMEFDSILCWRALLQEFPGSAIRPEIVFGLAFKVKGHLKVHVSSIFFGILWYPIYSQILSSFGV